VELVGGGGAGLHRSCSSHAQLAEGLDRAGARLGGHGGFAGEHCPGGGFGVDGVGLAVSAAVLAVGSVHLDDLRPACAQVAGQPRPPRAAALDAHHHELAEAAQPGEQTPVAVAGRRKFRRGQNAADVVDHRSDVHVLVSIHTAENPAPDTRPRDRGHATPSINRVGRHAPPGGRTGQ
jgi:hypothetical protein